MKRETGIKKLSDPDKTWDVVVIGGGASGLGAAVDAATRGYSTLLLEKYDFAKGTSSRSTKLIHGGVRYLAQGDIALVMEALKERGLLLQNAPHLVKNLKFVIPTYKWWARPFYTVGLKVYDMMSGKLGLGPSVLLSKEETLKALPTIQEDQLEGGVIYHDGQFDDSRLAVCLAQTLIENGGAAINYCGVTDLIKNEKGSVCGVKCTDLETGNSYEVKARVVINATGVFTDEILAMDEPGKRKTVVPSQGIHIVLDRSFLQSEDAIMIPRTSDGRVLFAVPWHGKVIVGTTDHLVDKPNIEPRAEEEEIDFVLNTAAQYLVKAPTRKDVLSIFAGLRPLAATDGEVEKTKEISRSHKVLVSESGLVSITGGKWTTYRSMGEDVMNKASLLGGLKEKACVTHNMPLHGYVKNVNRKDHLYVYGADIPKIKNLVEHDPELGQRLHDRLPYLKAEVVWAVREEMARTLDDVLSRRLRATFLDARASIEMAPQVADIMAAEMRKKYSWSQEQIREFTKNAEGYLLK
ncbi:MAG: glycerol-3-phosphate dehydrogenase/oxidase [Cyclobacteriaceae bacterium]|nr:glycerol-3-phosphate dehydrogenase/oxidase [Cyclobacteriaceae bacterium]